MSIFVNQSNALNNTPPHASRYLAAIVLFGLSAGLASAQSMTPAQFAEACRTNPGNRVDLAQQTKFQTTFQGTTFATPTGCNVVLAPGASLELDTITMNFGGAFVVQGNTGGKVVIDKATVSAPTVTLQLTGFEGQLQINEGRLNATAGDLVLAFGEKAKMEINQSGAWYQPQVTARGSLSITAGPFFNATLLNSGLQGTQGIGIALNGADSSMKFENIDLLLASGALASGPYITGSLNIASNAPKVSIEMNDVELMEASQYIDIELAGAESKLSLKSVNSQTSSREVFIGATGQKGEVKIEGALFYGIPTVTVVSGASGSTSVVRGQLTATSSVNVSTGAGGSCYADSLYINAQTLNLCR